MASIGSLTADLKLESAAFIRDLKKAADETARNTKAMQSSMAGLQKNFDSAASTFRNFVAGFASIAAVRTLANLGKQAIATADDIGAAAAKIGVSGEALQRFRFAAEQADVSTGELDNALKLFQRSLATGKLQSQSFDQFIQSIRDAPTQIEKVRIAQEGLGKQFQVGIALAAQSGDAFQKNFQNAFVISDRALAIASELDNQFRAISNAVQTGFDTGFLLAFNGALDQSQGSLTNLNEKAQQFGQLVGSAFKFAADTANVFLGALDTINTELKPVSDFLNNIQNLGQGIKQPLPDLSFEDMQKQLGVATPNIQTYGQSLISAADAAKALAQANRLWVTTLQEGASVFEQTRGPFEELEIHLNNLSELYRQGSIDAETFGRAHMMAAAAAVSPWLNVADTVAGALGKLFKDNQGVAIAQAIINTAQGITAALAQYPPPLSFAMAAAQAAAGAIQIATIKKTKPGRSGGTAPSVGGGSGASVARASTSSGGGAAAPAVQTQSRAINITVTGSGKFGQEMIRQLVDELNEAFGDGTRLNVSPV